MPDDSTSTTGRAMTNNVRKLRLARLLTKSELARRAEVSRLTIDRIESGKPCHMDTMRKIIFALGFGLHDRRLVFGLEKEEEYPRAEAETSADLVRQLVARQVAAKPVLRRRDSKGKAN